MKVFEENDVFITKVPLSFDGLNDGLNDRQKVVLNKINLLPGIKGKDLSAQLDIPIDTIDRYIKILSTKGLIVRKGSKKTGGYFVK